MLESCRRVGSEIALMGRHPRAHLRACGVYYLALACFLFTLAVYYPGYMSLDSVYQLQLARDGVTNNGNPPMMSYIWRILDHIVPGPGGMLILNAGLFWFALAAIAAAISRRNTVRAAVVLFCGFLPPIFGLIGTIWKDVGMHSFFLAALAFSLHAHLRRSPRLLLFSTLFIWLAGTYRHNAFVASLPLIIMNTVIAVPLLTAAYPRAAAAVRRRGLQRACVVGGTLALCAALWAATSFVNYHGVEDAQLWRSILVHDLAGISVCKDVNLLPEELTRKSGITIEDLKKIYVGHHLETIFYSSGRKLLGSPDPSSTAAVKTGVSGKVVLKQWAQAALDNPGCYLYHRSQIADKLLVLEAGNPWYPYHVGIDPNAYGFTFTPAPLNRQVTAWLQFAACSTYLYSAWIYHFMLVLAIFAAWLLPFRYGLHIQLVAASGLIYAMTNLFMAGSGDFRYNNWVIGACCVCVSLGAAGFKALPAPEEETPPVAVRREPAERCCSNHL